MLNYIDDYNYIRFKYPQLLCCYAVINVSKNTIIIKYNITNYESHFLLYQKQQSCTKSKDDGNEDYDAKAQRVCHRHSNKNDKQMYFISRYTYPCVTSTLQLAYIR